MATTATRTYTNLHDLIERSGAFLEWLINWQNNLPVKRLADIVGNQPGQTAIISVDIINGFCYEGVLSSPRVAAIVNPIAELFKHAYELGVRDFVLTQDTHDPQAEEFAQFPSHCVRGTHESQTVEALKSLPFSDSFTVVEKNSINSAINTTLERWLNERPHLRNIIVVGDCTDLCTDQLAMYLKLRSNAQGLGQTIITPANCIDTYDLPVNTANEIGAMPHDGDLLNLIFLYHYALNGIQVVKALE